MIKKIFVLGVFASLLMGVQSTSAINLGGQDVKDAATKAGYAEATETSLAETIGSVIKAVLSVIGIIFTVLMVYAGWLWMTARGEESQVEKAQDIIKASIIGLIITLSAYAITAFVVPAVLERTTSAPVTQE